MMTKLSTFFFTVDELILDFFYYAQGDHHVDWIVNAPSDISALFWIFDFGLLISALRALGFRSFWGDTLALDWMLCLGSLFLFKEGCWEQIWRFYAFFLSQNLAQSFWNVSQSSLRLAVLLLLLYYLLLVPLELGLLFRFFYLVTFIQSFSYFILQLTIFQRPHFYRAELWLHGWTAFKVAFFKLERFYFWNVAIWEVLSDFFIELLFGSKRLRDWIL